MQLACCKAPEYHTTPRLADLGGGTTAGFLRRELQRLGLETSGFHRQVLRIPTNPEGTVLRENDAASTGAACSVGASGAEVGETGQNWAPMISIDVH